MFFLPFQCTDDQFAIHTSPPAITSEERRTMLLVVYGTIFILLIAAEIWNEINR